MMEIRLNGENRQVADGITLQALVDELKVPNRAMAIAVNRRVVTKTKWAEHVLQAGDVVELVRAIGGG
ncbi:MAG: sulfur carrier protein ThiS [Oxalobacter sp.]|nr:sulfur carrier protein ThiS [Oxalobacter sp.]